MQSANEDLLTATARGVCSFVNQIVIGHACTVLRRQCQIHQFANKPHYTPFTLIPSICHIVTKDGLMTLWKGSVGSGVLWAMSQVTEVFIAEIFGLPKHALLDGNFNRFLGHVLVKAGTYFCMTPFTISSFIEIVRSNTGFTSEDSRVFDVVIKGVDRLRYFFNSKDSSRRFSILYLSIPSVIYGTSHFLISKCCYSVIFHLARQYVMRKKPHERTRFHAIMPEMFATITSNFIADIICYPFETVLHRLYIQGTRTLIDDLDNGVSAISITTKYKSLFDCLKSIITTEGFFVLYSGIAAVYLQYSLQICALNIIRLIFSQSTSAVNYDENERDIQKHTLRQPVYNPHIDLDDYTDFIYLQ